MILTNRKDEIKELEELETLQEEEKDEINDKIFKISQIIHKSVCFENDEALESKHGEMKNKWSKKYFENEEADIILNDHTKYLGNFKYFMEFNELVMIFASKLGVAVCIWLINRDEIGFYYDYCDKLKSQYLEYLCIIECELIRKNDACILTWDNVDKS